MRFSPDGRWIAYTSNVSGRPEVYVIPFSDPTRSMAAGGQLPAARTVRVSTGGGTSPRWREGGRELFYLVPSTNTIEAASVDGRGKEFVVESTESLFTLTAPDPSNASPYDAAPDGQRFLVTIPSSSAAGASGLPSPPTVVLNWTSLLQAAGRR